MEGGKLKWWEKAYWGVFVVAMSLFIFNRIEWEKEPPKVGAPAGVGACLLMAFEPVAVPHIELPEPVVVPSNKRASVREVAVAERGTAVFDKRSSHELQQPQMLVRGGTLVHQLQHIVPRSSCASTSGASGSFGANGTGDLSSAAARLTKRGMRNKKCTK